MGQGQKHKVLLKNVIGKIPKATGERRGHARDGWVLLGEGGVGVPQPHSCCRCQGMGSSSAEVSASHRGRTRPVRKLLPRQLISWFNALQDLVADSASRDISLPHPPMLTLPAPRWATFKAHGLNSSSSSKGSFFTQTISVGLAEPWQGGRDGPRLPRLQLLRNVQQQLVSHLWRGSAGRADLQLWVSKILTWAWCVPQQVEMREEPNALCTLKQLKPWSRGSLGSKRTYGTQGCPRLTPHTGLVYSFICRRHL